MRKSGTTATFALLIAFMAHGAEGQEGTTSGSAYVKRSVLTSQQLLAGEVPSTPVDDISGFAVPQQAGEPADIFEGTLKLDTPAKDEKFTLLSDVFGIVPPGDSVWKHLPALTFQFVQSGGYLVPVTQGLAITGNDAWNYIVGPGRVWQEKSDEGYTRASLPFALIQRNQNCVHNGEMTFLFSKAKSPKISNVYFQITQETCYPMKFNLWGMAAATYTPEAVAAAASLKAEHVAELQHRLPSKPFTSLSKDFPKAGFDASAILKAYQRPEEVTTYGVVFNGVNYSAGCPTRSGEYAFCDDMRLPSYSIAKSAFAGVALMRLGQLYGTAVYSEPIKNYIPAEIIGGKWKITTFTNASDMATGYYNSDVYEADEDSDAMVPFLVDEGLNAKLKDAFSIDRNHVAPGTKWVYQSSATFVLTQAMSAYLKKHKGTDADLFNMVRDDLYKPLHFSAGGLTTIRTENSSTGSPAGYYGLFFIKDDVAKIGAFLNRGDGKIDGLQVLEPGRLREALFRSSNAASVGVPILGTKSASIVGEQQSGPDKPTDPNTRRYAHGFWAKKVTPGEFPQSSCSFWVSLMSGYGGNIVALFPNGVTFYAFSDSLEFIWVNGMEESAKIAPMCQ
jgi:hypothetical protein